MIGNEELKSRTFKVSKQISGCHVDVDANDNIKCSANHNYNNISSIDNDIANADIDCSADVYTNGCADVYTDVSADDNNGVDVNAGGIGIDDTGGFNDDDVLLRSIARVTHKSVTFIYMNVTFL